MLDQLLTLLNIERGKLYTKHIKDVSFTIDYEDKSFIKDLVFSDKWPNAVDPSHIVVTSAAKKQRAQDIINYFVVVNIDNKRLLDYGCDQGYCVIAAKNKKCVAYGYDPTLPSNDSIITSNKSYIFSHSPYDIIMLYDTLDHIGPDQLDENIKFIKTLTHNGTTIYIRTHPYTSRHGGHSYLTHNKAFIHLFMDQQTMKDRKVHCDNDLRVIDPLTFYDDLFIKHGFKILSKNILRTAVEPIIKLVAPSLKLTYDQDLIHVMDIDFIDYVLQPDN